MSWTLGLAAAVAVPLVAVALGLAWIMRTDAGGQWLLARVPGLVVEGANGSPFGDHFEARRVRMAGTPGSAGLTLDGLTWRGARWSWLPGGGVWLALTIDSLQVRQVQVDTGPASSERLQAPRSLRLPIRLSLPALRIDTLRIDAQDPLTDLDAAVTLGGPRGDEHRIELRRLHWNHLEAQGQARIGADAPFAVDATTQVHAGGQTPWDAETRAQGQLASIEMRAQLAGRVAAGAAPAALDAQAQIRPFEAWPLGDVTANTHALDLASIVPGAPRTRLAGHVRVSSQGLRQPIGVSIELDNAVPARLGDGGLPLHSVRLKLLVDPRQPDRLLIGPFDVQAADAQGAAGRWQGGGVWEGAQLRLQTQLADLQPQRLDRHLAPMRLGGPLTLTVDGLPSPDPQAPRQAWGGVGTLALGARGSLEGHVAGAPDEVALVFEAQASSQSIDLASLRASSGGARAQLRAHADRKADGRWGLKSQGTLDAFDPALWLPSREGAAWQPGVHRLNATWTIDLLAPQPRAPIDPLRVLATAVGQATLDLTDSRLAGVPASGHAEWQQGTAGLPVGRGKADIQVASARLQVDASLDAGGDGRKDRVNLQLTAPALAELSPVLALVPGAQAWLPRQGELELRADQRGRWPDAALEWHGRTSALQTGPLTVEKAEVTGRWERDQADGLGLQLDATRLRWREARIDSVRADVRGSTDEHRFEAELRVPGQPAPELTRALMLPEGRGAAARLVGKGRWSTDATGGGRWLGDFERLWLGPHDDQPIAAGAPRWAESNGLQMEAQFDASGRAQKVVLLPGRAGLGPVHVRWTDAQWQAAGTAGGNPTTDTWRAKAAIEPVAVAPWLQQLQQGRPGALQWSGDLKLSAQLDLRAGTAFDAELRVQRDDGDLRFTEGSNTQSLGLSQAEIVLSAHEGLWRLTPRIQGERLGRIGGEWSARSAAADRWPAPGATLDGQIQVQVPALAAWAAWLPPGWRLQGELDGLARVSGTLRAPGYAGHLKADHVGLRNVLQGVDLTDGTLNVQLKGDQARIETLSLRGGEGLLTARGNATFGAHPELTLTANAQKLRVLGRVDRQLVVTGQAALHAQAQRLELDGRLVADSGLFDLSRRDAPTLDDDVTVVRGAEVEPPEAIRREPTALMRSLQVSLDLDLGRQLRLKGRGLDTLLAGMLKFTVPNGRPQLQGTVRAERGTYAAYGQKLEIERGLVIFSGPIDGARLDVLALRPNLDTRVGVAITGPAMDPRVRLYSDPDMAETDKLSWLVLGRGPDGLGRTDTALLQRAAMALLSGEGESPSTALLRAIGLDELSIRQSDGEVRETFVAVGKQISSRWYVGYERGVNATSGTWQLIYRAAQRFTLRAQSGEDNSIDLIWTWRFGKP